jgi:hypothetical protein
MRLIISCIVKNIDRKKEKISEEENLQEWQESKKTVNKMSVTTKNTGECFIFRSAKFI